MLNESELFGDIDEYILNKVKEQNGFALFSGKEIADELPMEKSNLINLFNGVLNDIRLYVIILTK